MNKQLWIAEKLQMRDYTREELLEAWRDVDINRAAMRRSTFYDNLRALENNFGFVVENNNGVYHLRIESDIQLIMLEQLTLKSASTQIKGLQWVQPLSEGISHTRLLRMHYAPLDKPSYDTLIAPHCFHHSQGYIYVVGYSSHHGNDFIRLFALDRIQSIENVSKRFKRDRNFSYAEHFKYSFGPYAGPHFLPEEIVLRSLTAGEEKYLRTRPLHHSQREIEPAPDGSARFSLYVAPTEDFIMEMMRLSGYIVVESPENLRKILCDRARLLLKNIRGTK